jgi:hypothetical protein
MIMMLAEVLPLSKATHHCKTNEGVYDCDNDED